MWRGAVRQLSSPHKYPIYGISNKGHSRNMFILGSFISLGTGLLAYRAFQKSEQRRQKLQAEYKPLDPYEATAPKGDYVVDENKLRKVILEGDSFLRTEILKDLNKDVEDYALRNVAGVSRDKFTNFVKDNIEQLDTKQPSTTHSETTTPTPNEQAKETEVISTNEQAEETEVITPNEQAEQPEVIPPTETLEQPEVAPSSEPIEQPEVIPPTETLEQPEVITPNEPIEQPEVIPSTEQPEVTPSTPSTTPSESVEELKAASATKEKIPEPHHEPTPEASPEPQDLPDLGVSSASLASISLSGSEYSAKLDQIRNEIKEQQIKQEEDLLKKVNESIQSMVDQLIPKLVSQLRSIEPPTTAEALTEQIDFSQASADQIRRKFEEVIGAYEAKLEGLGIMNYDYFLQKLDDQKQSFKLRLEEVKAQYKQEVEKSLIPRDQEWQATIVAELDQAAEHHQKQTELDLDHVIQQTELKLTQTHQEEIAKITDTLQQAASQRLSEMDNMIHRIKQIEILQEKQFNAILALFAVHKLHVTVENMQRTLISDVGSFTNDLQALKEFAVHDRVVATVLSILNDYYPYLLEHGVPTQAQLLRKFKQSSQNARKSALMNDDTLTSWLTATIAYNFIPQNTKDVDEFDSFSMLSSAESALHKGDFKGALKVLNKLSGFPKEEMSVFIKDLSSRVAIMHMLEVLSTLSIAVVNDLVNIKFKY